MKVEDKRNSKQVDFEALKVGDVFQCATNFWIKIDDDYGLDFETSLCEEFSYDEPVVKVKAKIVIED